MFGDDFPGLVSTCQVQHGLQAAVVQGCTGDRHGAGFKVPTGISCRMPRHVTEERPPGEHPVKPVDEVHGSGSSARWEEFQGEEVLIVSYFGLCKLHEKSQVYIHISN